MKTSLLLPFFFLLTLALHAQDLWHGIERFPRYQPEGEDVVITNGNRRFNRALYGSSTAFRAEAGDLPEFALYLPGMGGNLKIGLIRGGLSKWVIHAKKIKSVYRAGSMLYEISDPVLGDGTLRLRLLPDFNREALMIRISGENLPADLQIVPVFGGVSGRKFSRDGDFGADPESSFDLKPEYCHGNTISIAPGQFQIRAASGGRSVKGTSSRPLDFRLGSARAQESPLMLLASADTTAPLVMAVTRLNNQPLYLQLYADTAGPHEGDIAQHFMEAEAKRMVLSKKVIVRTPDPYLNVLGPALSMAADAIWEHPSYMHGAVAWRMRLNGWRGAYIADALGDHDRAKAHFNGYLKVQVQEPLTAPVVMDTALNLARHLEKLSTSLFSAGYISREPDSKLRAHHYDMNLVFFDQILYHLDWTGDTSYARKIWPQLLLHLNWEKRNFDADGDGLYDSYAAIWASDALQYSAGAVTHSSAYNYSANRMAARLARILGKDPHPFLAEADKIRKAIDQTLWMPARGWYAEYRDHLSNRLLHDVPGIWTVYHAIDEGITDPFQAWQSLRYVDHQIPHIPIRIKGFSDTSLYTISTTNWQPYTWSLNNVALSELMHMTLAYWQGQRSEEGFKLFQSTLMESMFFGASPGNLQQLTFYDAMRGELYRDFADGIGMTGRALVEGLFGIRPNLLDKEILIAPGFPAAWDSAFISTSDLMFRYQQTGTKDRYQIGQHMFSGLNIRWQLPARGSRIQSVLVNGKPAPWKISKVSVGDPRIELLTSMDSMQVVEIIWGGDQPLKVQPVQQMGESARIEWTAPEGKILGVRDPQQALKGLRFSAAQLSGQLTRTGPVTLFVQLQQDALTWWYPVHLLVEKAVKPVYVYNRNPIVDRLECIGLQAHFNTRVTDIFNEKYLSPRPAVPTLQLPVQGIGNWAYPLVQPLISDSGWRKRAGQTEKVVLSNGVVFSTPGSGDAKNILFVSKWDNFPDSVSVPLEGQGSFVHLLMAGSTNSMQSRITNGVVYVHYTDGSRDSLELRNPENWWPIEQDYYEDGYAFRTDAPKPIRIALKTGQEIAPDFRYTGIKGFSGRGIEGGAATVLGLPVRPEKRLRRLVLKAVANDVVIGLMGVSVKR